LREAARNQHGEVARFNALTQALFPRKSFSRQNRCAGAQRGHIHVVSKAPNDKSKRRPSEPKEKPAEPREIGGRKGPDPTRYGDWEKDGRCIDF
jgi:hypothetical protein